MWSEHVYHRSLQHPLGWSGHLCTSCTQIPWPSPVVTRTYLPLITVSGYSSELWPSSWFAFWSRCAVNNYVTGFCSSTNKFIDFISSRSDQLKMLLDLSFSFRSVFLWFASSFLWLISFTTGAGVVSVRLIAWGGVHFTNHGSFGSFTYNRIYVVRLFIPYHYKALLLNLNCTTNWLKCTIMMIAHLASLLYCWHDLLSLLQFFCLSYIVGHGNVVSLQLSCVVFTIRYSVVGVTLHVIIMWRCFKTSSYHLSVVGHLWITALHL